MKRLLLVFAALLAVAQNRAPEIQTVFWVDGTQTLLSLGQSFTLNGRVLDVAHVAATRRVWNKRLTYDATAGGWALPAGATNVVVWFHGHRLVPAEAAAPSMAYDYTIDGAVVKPKDGSQPWASYFHVYFDYDLPEVK